MDISFTLKDMDEYVTVVDVYDSAALIGKDFEYLIEQYGVEAVTELMPKVIRVLEQLEYLASKCEKENEYVVQMESTIKRLHKEKEDRSSERERYEQELEQIEESYRKETKDLYQMVATLQEQNKRLQSRLNEKSVGQEFSIDKTQEDINVIESLKDTVTKQRNVIIGLQNDVKQKDSDIESINSQLERLSHDKETLRIASNLSQSASDKLLADHIALQNTIKEKEQQIKTIRDGMTQQNLTKTDAVDQKEAEQKKNIIGTIVGNVKEAESPKFTLNELKDILTERNTLKSKLIEIEEELSYYKNKDRTDSEGLRTGGNEEDLFAAFSIDDSVVGEVQGPINREPWEKLHGKPESGIRKFFKLFGHKNDTKSFRKRRQLET